MAGEPVNLVFGDHPSGHRFEEQFSEGHDFALSGCRLMELQSARMTPSTFFMDERWGLVHVNGFLLRTICSLLWVLTVLIGGWLARRVILKYQSLGALQ